MDGRTDGRTDSPDGRTCQEAEEHRLGSTGSGLDGWTDGCARRQRNQSRGTGNRTDGPGPRTERCKDVRSEGRTDGRADHQEPGREACQDPEEDAKTDG